MKLQKVRPYSERKFLNRLKGCVLKKRSSIKLALIIILVFVSGVNAYDLFYVPNEGKVIKLSTDTTPQRSVKYFEKVDVLTPETPASEAAKAAKNKQSSKSQPEEPEIQAEGLVSKAERTSLEENTPLKFELNTPEFDTDNKLGEEHTTRNESPSSPPIRKEDDNRVETQIPAISASEVRKLANKFGFYSLKDGAIIELHISESYGEQFVLFVQSGQAYINEGVASDKDLAIWVTRSGFAELLKTNDVSLTVKQLENKGKISIKQYSSTWTLYRKGYKELAENFGFI